MSSNLQNKKKGKVTINNGMYISNYQTEELLLKGL